MTGEPARIGALRTPEAQQDLDWTGERMLPWLDDPTIAYEHLHRYAFAAQLVAGRRVLDLGSGEGYGTALLAAHAADVTGVDVDGEAVRHAAATYRSPNLRFAEGSAEALTAFADDSFDVVVCFEVIEHVAAQEHIVAEARRVLRADGLFICSTPERDAYRERTGEENPFHVRELDMSEFRALLTMSFPAVALWSQQPLTGSLLEPLEAVSGAGDAYYVTRNEGHWDFCERPAPLYLVAVASAGTLPSAERSVLADPALELSERQRERAEQAERDLHEARVERAEAEEHIRGAIAGMKRREMEVGEQVAIADGLRAELIALAAESAQRQERVIGLERRLERIENSPSWRALEAARAPLRRADGSPNAAGRLVSALLRALSRRLPGREPSDER